MEKAEPVQEFPATRSQLEINTRHLDFRDVAHITTLQAMGPTWMIKPYRVYILFKQILILEDLISYSHEGFLKPIKRKII